MAHRILIVEDHTLLREGLRAMFASVAGFEVAGEARDGREALLRAMDLKPDLITMDLSLPDMSGIEATREIKRRHPEIRVLALTVQKSEEYVREALKAGADGYVLKDASYEELVAAIHQVLAGKLFLSSEVKGQVVSRYLTGGSAARPASHWERLTDRERSIAKLVAEGRTNRAAAECLNLSPKTVEKHRASLMQKLGLRSATELVLMALQQGWIEREHMIRANSSQPLFGRRESRSFQDTEPFLPE